jgi:hypothetical protein
MARKLHKVRQVVFNDRGDGTLFVKRNITQDEPDGFFDGENDELPVDVNGHVMRTVQEVGGRCFCGVLLCKDCVGQNRCVLCLHTLCQNHASTINGKTVCPRHGFLEYMATGLLK